MEEIADVDMASIADSSSIDDDVSEADTAATSVDDGLPHPRVGLRNSRPQHFLITNIPQPFESRREFFVRTSAEWQEILMTSLRWKGIQPETLTIKEIKSKAFELSEEKWWDCREEITALEDEQEAAGIGEVVSLTDRGDSAAGGAGRRRDGWSSYFICQLHVCKCIVLLYSSRLLNEIYEKETKPSQQLLRPIVRSL